jgi:hypothetical protein
MTKTCVLIKTKKDEDRTNERRKRERVRDASIGVGQTNKAAHMLGALYSNDNNDDDSEIKIRRMRVIVVQRKDSRLMEKEKNLMK